MPGADKAGIFNLIGYMMAYGFVELPRLCGRYVTRESIMRQPATLDFRVPMLLPGMRLATRPDDFHPLKTLRTQRFDGKSFVMFGKPIRGTPTIQR